MENHIDRAYRRALRLDFDDSTKFVFLSDCHRGHGSWVATYQPNQT
ncbi:MAG: serine/threonine protein phosphatase, partial [Clostridiales bacterium]|nr:serine/threonine protein phosphatase [Clostridiales bacterium]